MADQDRTWTAQQVEWIRRVNEVVPGAPPLAAYILGGWSTAVMQAEDAWAPVPLDTGALRWLVEHAPDLVATALGPGTARMLGANLPGPEGRVVKRKD
jgi:hypothetical protein